MSLSSSAVCPECFGVNPDKLFFKQDTEEIVGCSDCVEFANYVDDQYGRLVAAQGSEYDEDDSDPGDMDGDHQSALASAGFGTDEDYNHGDFGEGFE